MHIDRQIAFWAGWGAAFFIGLLMTGLPSFMNLDPGLGGFLVTVGSAGFILSLSVPALSLLEERYPGCRATALRPFAIVLFLVCAGWAIWHFLVVGIGSTETKASAQPLQMPVRCVLVAPPIVPLDAEAIRVIRVSGASVNVTEVNLPADGKIVGLGSLQQVLRCVVRTPTGGSSADLDLPIVIALRSATESGSGDSRGGSAEANVQASGGIIGATTQQISLRDVHKAGGSGTFYVFNDSRDFVQIGFPTAALGRIDGDQKGRQIAIAVDPSSTLYLPPALAR
jgi:hypothetical protein